MANKSIHTGTWKKGILKYVEKSSNWKEKFLLLKFCLGYNY